MLAFGYIPCFIVLTFKCTFILNRILQRFGDLNLFNFYIILRNLYSMSAVFAGGTQAGIKPERSTIQKLLDENGQLIQAVVRYQNMGRLVAIFHSILKNFAWYKHSVG